MTAAIVNRLDLQDLGNSANDKDKGTALGERMDLVEHVKVKVTVTLGGTELTVGQLFALSTGSIISMDKDVDAPVDVRIGGKLIARGTLVAVGDKFGVRVTEIEPDRA